MTYCGAADSNINSLAYEREPASPKCFYFLFFYSLLRAATGQGLFRNYEVQRRGNFVWMSREDWTKYHKVKKDTYSQTVLAQVRQKQATANKARVETQYLETFCENKIRMIQARSNHKSSLVYPNWSPFLAERHFEPKDLLGGLCLWEKFPMQSALIKAALSGKQSRKHRCLSMKCSSTPHAASAAAATGSLVQMP